MISFAIVALCLIPLIAPNVWMIQEDRLFLRELERDRYTGLIFANAVEQLYQNSIPWGNLEQSVPITVEKEKIGIPNQWPYTIRVIPSISKGKQGAEGADFYLLNLDVFFTSTSEPIQTHDYVYLLFAEKTDSLKENSQKNEENKEVRKKE